MKGIDTGKKYRLVTKADIDGMACGVLLSELGMVDSFAFVHPSDIESGGFAITENDITAGLPYSPKAFLAFDYYPHPGLAGYGDNFITGKNMPSTSRVIYNHYGRGRFKHISIEMLEAVDKGFSADINMDEILYPTGWTLLSYLIDRRTGLDRFHHFNIPQAELLVKIIEYSRGHNILEILDLSDVEERLEFYFSCIQPCSEQLLRCSKVHYNLVFADLRGESVIYPGNRFMIYALFPECNVSLHAMPVDEKGKCLFIAGKSVIDRSYDKDIGAIMRSMGGGGHANAGTCQCTGKCADMDALIGKLSYGLLANVVKGYFNY